MVIRPGHAANRLPHDDIPPEEQAVLRTMPTFKTREMAINDVMKRLSSLNKPLVCRRKTWKNVWYVCTDHSCPFRVTLSYSKKSGCWSYYRYACHQCVEVTTPNCKDMRKYLLQPFVRMRLPSKSVGKLVGGIHGLHLTKHQLSCFFRRRKLCLDLERRISFLKLPKYLEKLKDLNPGTTTDLQVTTSHLFKSCFICPWSSVVAFLSCPPLIFIDACHRVFPEQGHIFIAGVQDGNQQNVPLAIGVYDGETIENWCQFIRMLDVSLSLSSMDALTFISDRAPGILNAVSSILPRAHHSYCSYHLQNNLQSHGYKRTDDSLIVSRLASSESQDSFTTILESIEPESARVWMSSINPEHFCLFAFPGRRFGRTASSGVESMNNWLNTEELNLRSLPVLYLLDRFMSRCNETFFERRLLYSHRNPLHYSDHCMTIVEKNFGDGSVLSCSQFADGRYMVGLSLSTLDRVEVDLNRGTCGCHRFQDTVIPCMHAMCAISSQQERTGVSWKRFTLPCYSIYRLQRVYSEFTTLPTIPHLLSSPLFPPPRFTRLGRSQSRRFASTGERTTGRRVSVPRRRARNFDERGVVSDDPLMLEDVNLLGVDLSNIGNNTHEPSLGARSYRCLVCRGYGHNSRTCPNNVAAVRPSTTNRTIAISGSGTSVMRSEVSETLSSVNGEPSMNEDHSVDEPASEVVVSSESVNPEVVPASGNVLSEVIADGAAMSEALIPSSTSSDVLVMSSMDVSPALLAEVQQESAASTAAAVAPSQSTSHPRSESDDVETTGVQSSDTSRSKRTCRLPARFRNV